MSGKELRYPFADGCDDLPRGREEDVRRLRAWLAREKQYPNLSDEHLYLFLHSNNYSEEDTRKTIEVFFSVRREAPELFADRDPFGLEETWKVVYQSPLPRTTPEGYRVIITKFSCMDPNKFNYTHSVKLMLLMLDVRISEDKLCPGYYIVFDTEGFTWRHFFKLNLSTMRKSMRYIQEAIPLRLKGIFIVNSVSFIDKVLSAFRPFMNSRIMDLIHIYGSDLAEFYDYIPKEILPAEYGGCSGTMESLHGAQRSLTETKYSEWFQQEQTYYRDSAGGDEERTSTTTTKASLLSFLNPFASK